MQNKQKPVLKVPSETSKRKTIIDLSSINSSHALVHGVGNIRNTLLPLLKEDFMMNNHQIGILSAVPPLLQAVFSLPAGWASDKYGSKKLVFYSLIMLLVGTLIAGVSVNPWMYVFSAVLMTVTSTIFHPPAFCIIADVTKLKERSKYMGLFNAGGTLGMSLGPLSVTVMVGVLSLHWRQMYLAWTVPVLAGIAFLLMIGINESPSEKLDPSSDVEVLKSSQPESLLTSEFLLYITSRGIRMFGLGMFAPFLSIYLMEVRAWPIAQIGLMMGISGILGLGAAPLGGILASKMGEKKFVIISTILSSTAFIIAFYTDSDLAFITMYLVYRLFIIMAMPGQATITARLSPPKQMGMGFALTFLPSSVTGVIAPVAAAWVIDVYGYLPLFMLSSLAMYVSTGLFGVAVKNN